MSTAPTILLFVFNLFALVAVVAVVYWVTLRRPSTGDEGTIDPTEWVDDVVVALREQTDLSQQANLDATLSIASSKLGDQLAAGADVLGRERSAVQSEVAQVRNEMHRVSTMLADLQRERAEQNGRLVTGLEQAVAVTTSLASTTQSLREVLASPKSRGQWGERMAEDVLRHAGFVEGINFVRQTKTASGGLPDFSFPLPKGRVVNMDVKFPIDNYIRWVQCDGESEREALAKAFRRDVRARVSELGGRGYIDPDLTVDYLILFIPNESVFGFCHEHDPDLLDFAIAQKVVLCSPSTLFAVLGVIRQAADNFAVEQRSGEIMAAMAGLRDQWDRFGDSVDKVGRALSSAQKSFDDLSTTRRRQMEKQVSRMEDLRDQRTLGPAAEDDQPQISGLRSVV